MWSTQNVLDVTIIEHADFGVLEIVAFDTDLQMEAPRLYVDKETIGNIIGLDFIDRIACLEKEKELRNNGTYDLEELMLRAIDQANVDYILHRLCVVNYSKEEHVVSVEIIFNMADKAQLTDGFGINELVIVRPSGMHPFQNIIKITKASKRALGRNHGGPATPTGKTSTLPPARSYSGSTLFTRGSLGSNIIKPKFVRRNAASRLPKSNLSTPFTTETQTQTKPSHPSNVQEVKQNSSSLPVKLSQGLSMQSSQQMDPKSRINSEIIDISSADTGNNSTAIPAVLCTQSSLKSFHDHDNLSDHHAARQLDQAKLPDGATRAPTAIPRRRSLLTRISISLGILTGFHSDSYKEEASPPNESDKLPSVIDGLLSSHDYLTSIDTADQTELQQPGTKLTNHTRATTTSKSTAPSGGAFVATTTTTTTASTAVNPRMWWWLPFLVSPAPTHPEDTSLHPPHHLQKQKNHGSQAGSLRSHHHATSFREFSERTAAGPFTVLISNERRASTEHAHTCTTASANPSVLPAGLGAPAAAAGGCSGGDMKKAVLAPHSQALVSGLLLGKHKVTPGR